MRIVTIAALHCALEHFVVERLGKLCLGFAMTAYTKLRFALLEHEVQHHGQLIRFVYGNKLSFPESWNKRYTV